MKYIIPMILLTSFIVLLILGLAPIDLRDDLVLEASSVHDSYLTEIGLNPHEFSNKEKETIYNYELTFLQRSTMVDYITPSINRYVYERNWQIHKMLVRNRTPEIAFQAYLFQDPEEKFHIIVSYERYHNITGNHFFTISHSDEFTLDFESQYLSLEYNDSEYVIGGSGYQTEDLLDGYRLMSYNLKQYFKNPVTKGFYHFYLRPNNNAFTPSYVNLELSMYQDATVSMSETIVLGFNGFRNNPNNPKWIPQAIGITYIKED